MHHYDNGNGDYDINDTYDEDAQQIDVIMTTINELQQHIRIATIVDTHAATPSIADIVMSWSYMNTPVSYMLLQHMSSSHPLTYGVIHAGVQQLGKTFILTPLPLHVQATHCN